MRIDRSDDHDLMWQRRSGWEFPTVWEWDWRPFPTTRTSPVRREDGGSDSGFLLRSDDGARRIHTGVDNPIEMSDVIVSPSGQYVFASGDAGLFVSSDHGLHWQKVPGSPSGATRLMLSDHDLFLRTGKGIYLI
jgi:hypothetical protein